MNRGLRILLAAPLWSPNGIEPALPATLLLRPLGFDTLATHLYGEAVRGTYEDAALAALLIVAVGLVPVILLARVARVPAMSPGAADLPPALLR